MVLTGDFFFFCISEKVNLKQRLNNIQVGFPIISIPIYDIVFEKLFTRLNQTFTLGTTVASEIENCGKKIKRGTNVVWTNKLLKNTVFISIMLSSKMTKKNCNFLPRYSSLLCMSIWLRFKKKTMSYNLLPEILYACKNL